MFFSLQNYTTYSILSGVKEPSVWVARAAELGYPALGICDKSNLGGHIEFQNECDKVGIKPIFGAEYRLVDDCQLKEKDNKGVILLFVKDSIGYKNLVYLNNFAHDNTKGYYYKPRLDIDIISQNCEGLIMVVPSNDGAYQAESAKKHHDFLMKAHEAFGEDLYLGINPHHPNKEVDESTIVMCLNGFGTMVLVYDCHCPLEGDEYLYEVVRAVDNNRRNGAHNYNRVVTKGFLPENPGQEVEALQEIYDKCDYRIPLGTYHMPHVELIHANTLEGEVAYNLCRGIDKKLFPKFFDTHIDEIMDAGADAVRYMCKLIRDFYPDEIPHYRALKYPDKTETMERLSVYADRLEYEFGVIEKLGFLDYFLIVKDICNFVDEQGEERGPARGSAGGSLFSYLADITKMDPIEDRLLFERFLNPDRADLPDIDLDFSSAGRDAVKAYISEKYGVDNVVSIGSYERLKIASAVQTVASAYAYGIPDNEGEIIHYERYTLTEKLDGHVSQTARGEQELAERLEIPVFAEFYNRHSEWFDTVIMPLQETISGMSIHAAGTLITAFPIDECLPVYKRSDGTILSQWRDRHCESRGFPKFDILAIKAVDMISYAKKLIKKIHGVEIPDIELLPRDDDAAMAIYREGKTDGVFQVKSFIAKKFAMDLQPDNFDENVAATALNRPGPLDAEADKLYLQIKRGQILPEYDHPDMIPICQSTYGLIIFQEQMMQTVRVMGGLSPVEADYVRKACGKKKLDEMAKWESAFINGGLERGIDEDVLHTLWTKVNAFAGYGFCLAHATAYSLIGYYHAWIKAHYPAEFWCAALKYASSDAKKYEAVFNLKARAREEGINFVYPNIFGFASDFYPKDPTSIYWPIEGVKGIGPKATEVLTNAGERTYFDSLPEMVETLGKDLNLGVYKTLISIGFFEPLADTPWEAAKLVFDTRNELLGKKDQIPFELSTEDEFEWHIARNDAYGFIVRPWKEVGDWHAKVQRIPENVFANVPDGTRLFVGGYVEKISIRQHKVRKKNDGNKNRFYAVLTLVDENEQFRVMMWAGFWMNKEHDYSGNRPMKGDLIELIGYKDSWTPDGGNTQHSLKTADDSYMRKVRST